MSDNPDQVTEEPKRGYPASHAVCGVVLATLFMLGLEFVSANQLPLPSIAGQAAASQQQ